MTEGESIPNNQSPFLIDAIALSFMLLGFAALTGRLSYELVADSPSYIHYPFGSLDAALRSIRTPGYPAILALVTSTLGIAAMPLVHIVLMATAGASLSSELRRWNTSRWPSFLAGFAVTFSCTTLDNVAIVSTDAPAAAIGAMVVVCLMRWARLQARLTAMIPMVLLALLAIALRPAYLAIIPWITIAGIFVLTQRSAMIWKVSTRQAIVSPIIASILIALPVCGWMVLRGIVVNDFGILPFGHQNLAGITVQLVGEDELLSSSGESAKLAQAIVRRQHDPTQQVREETEEPATNYMTMENRWNDLIWKVVVPASEDIHLANRRVTKDPVLATDNIADHRAIAALNREILARYPLRYVRWLLLASRRAVWGSTANIVMHPIFLLAIIIVVLAECYRTWLGTSLPQLNKDVGLDLLFVASTSYFVVMVGFVILTSPPLGRFADAGAIFFPALFAAHVARRLKLCPTI